METAVLLVKPPGQFCDVLMVTLPAAAGLTFLESVWHGIAAKFAVTAAFPAPVIVQVVEDALGLASVQFATVQLEKL